MTITLPSHPGVLISDPRVTVVATIDRPMDRTFQPSVLVESGPSIRIHYELPPQPYVDGTWNDACVADAVQAHIATLAVRP